VDGGGVPVAGRHGDLDTVAFAAGRPPPVAGSYRAAGNWLLVDQDSRVVLGPFDVGESVSGESHVVFEVRA
jgi:hypothetical protein